MADIQHKTYPSLFSDIADAIREKTGETNQLLADTFPELIRKISGGGAENTLEVASIRMIDGNNNPDLFISYFDGSEIKLDNQAVKTSYTIPDFMSINHTTSAFTLTALSKGKYIVLFPQESTGMSPYNYVADVNAGDSITLDGNYYRQAFTIAKVSAGSSPAPVVSGDNCVSYHSGARSSKVDDALGLIYSNSNYVTKDNNKCTVNKAFDATIYLTDLVAYYPGGFFDVSFNVNDVAVKTISRGGPEGQTQNETFDYSFKAGDVYYFNARGRDASSWGSGSMVVIAKGSGGGSSDFDFSAIKVVASQGSSGQSSRDFTHTITFDKPVTILNATGRTTNSNTAYAGYESFTITYEDGTSVTVSGSGSTGGTSDGFTFERNQGYWLPFQSSVLGNNVKSIGYTHKDDESLNIKIFLSIAYLEDQVTSKVKKYVTDSTHSVYFDEPGYLADSSAVVASLCGFTSGVGYINLYISLRNADTQQWEETQVLKKQVSGSNTEHSYMIIVENLNTSTKYDAMKVRHSSDCGLVQISSSGFVMIKDRSERNIYDEVVTNGVIKSGYTLDVDTTSGYSYNITNNIITATAQSGQSENIYASVYAIFDKPFVGAGQTVNCNISETSDGVSHWNPQTTAAMYYKNVNTGARVGLANGGKLPSDGGSYQIGFIEEITHFDSTTVGNVNYHLTINSLSVTK